MAVEKNTQLVGTIDKLVFAKHMLDRLRRAAITEKFVQGKDGVVAGW